METKVTISELIDELKQLPAEAEVVIVIGELEVPLTVISCDNERVALAGEV